jgi:parallel beta-helix repeat protein
MNLFGMFIAVIFSRYKKFIDPFTVNNYNHVMLTLIDASQRMGSSMLYRNSKTINHIVKNNKNGHLPVATIVIAAVASLLGVPPVAQAACNTYYVSTTGQDTNSGDIAHPWLSIYYSANKLAPCDTLYVRGGTYSQAKIWVSKSGTATQPIKIMAYPNEFPILDLSGSSLVMGQYDAFITLGGQYIQLSGFELRNGIQGVNLYGPNNQVANMNVHHMSGNGITAMGDFSIVENNTVWLTGLAKYNALLTGTTLNWGTGITAARDPINGITDHAILRGNTVHDHYGEGLSTYEANGTIIENNTVYNNWAQNTYISDSSNVIFRNNLVYNTPNNGLIKGGTLLPSGVLLGDEVSSKPRSTNNIVVNNMFLNADIVAFQWTQVPGSGLVNALIANNTIINGTIKTGTINQGSTIQNNIFFTNKGIMLANIPTRSGLKLSNNLWSANPPPNAMGTGDVLDNPKLALVGVVQPGQLTKCYFAVSSSSPAIGKGAAIYGITDDYLITSKSAVLNIGAYLANPPIQYLTGTLTANALDKAKQ